MRQKYEELVVSFDWRQAIDLQKKFGRWLVRLVVEIIFITVWDILLFFTFRHVVEWKIV